MADMRVGKRPLREDWALKVSDPEFTATTGNHEDRQSGLVLFIIFLNEGAFVALLWLVTTLIYANLVVLLYLAINFESIVTKLLGL